MAARSTPKVSSDAQLVAVQNDQESTQDSTQPQLVAPQNSRQSLVTQQLQVLTSMAATSIPEVSSDTQMVAVQNDPASSQPQLVAFQNSRDSPVAQQLQVLTSMVETSIPEVSSDTQMVAVQNNPASSQPQLVAFQNSGHSPVAQQLQVLASMAATSTPEVLSDAQMEAVQNDQDSSQPQLVALQNSDQSPVAQQLHQHQVTDMMEEEPARRKMYTRQRRHFMPELETLVGLDPTAGEKMKEGLRKWRGRTSDDFAIEQDEEIGLCVVSKRRFAKWDFLMEYEGEYITRKERERREIFYELNDPGSFIVDAVFHKKLVSVDATRTLGTFGRLVNHARGPNARGPNVRYWNNLLEVYPGQPPRMVLYCHEPIEPGDQLYWDYGVSEKEAVWANCHRSTTAESKRKPMLCDNTKAIALPASTWESIIPLTRVRPCSILLTRLNPEVLQTNLSPMMREECSSTHTNSTLVQAPMPLVDLPDLSVPVDCTAPTLLSAVCLPLLDNLEKLLVSRLTDCTKRWSHLKESVGAQDYLWEVSDLEGCMKQQFVFVCSDDVRDEHVTDSMALRYEELQMVVDAVEEHFMKCDYLAMDLVEDKSRYSTEILNRQEQLRSLWHEFSDAVSQQQRKLSEIHGFCWDVEDVLYRMQEMHDAIPADLGRDLEHVQSYQKRQEAFEIGLISIKAPLQALVDDSARLQEQYPGGYTKLIQQQEVLLTENWGVLKERATKRADDLRAALNGYMFMDSAHDLEQWASRLEKELVCEITEHDDSSIEITKKRHADIKVEMDAKEDLFSSVVDIGLTKIANKRSANKCVKDKVANLLQLREQLQVMWEEKEKYLQQSLHAASQLGNLSTSEEMKDMQTAKKLPVKQKKTDEERRLAHCASQAAYYQHKKEDEAFKAKRKKYNDHYEANMRVPVSQMSPGKAERHRALKKEGNVRRYHEKKAADGKPSRRRTNKGAAAAGADPNC